MSDYGIDSRFETIRLGLPAALAATTDDTYVLIALAPVAGEVRAARLCNMTTLAAGDGTNNRSWTIAKGTAPTFGTTMASLSGNGQAFTADTPVAFTMSAAAARRFAAGESVAAVAAHAGTGGAHVVGDTIEIFVVWGQFDYAQS